MSELLFGDWDPVLSQIADALCQYEKDHPGARISLYRHNSVSVRIRIIDPSFATINKTRRDKTIWPLLPSLPEDVLSEITVLLLLTPEELESSLGNLDFERPIPSML